jgi:hypothetical protein
MWRLTASYAQEYRATNEPLLARLTSRLDRSGWIRNYDHVDSIARITLAVQPDNVTRMPEPEPEEQLV